MCSPGSPVIPTDAVKHRNGTRTVLLACVDWPGALQGRGVTGSATHDLRRAVPGTGQVPATVCTARNNHTCLWYPKDPPWTGMLAWPAEAPVMARAPTRARVAGCCRRPRRRCWPAAAARPRRRARRCCGCSRARRRCGWTRTPRARPRSPGTGSPPACRGARRAPPAERRSRSCALLPRSGAGRLGGGLRAAAATHEARLLADCRAVSWRAARLLCRREAGRRRALRRRRWWLRSRRRGWPRRRRASA